MKTRCVEAFVFIYVTGEKKLKMDQITVFWIGNILVSALEHGRSHRLADVRLGS